MNAQNAAQAVAVKAKGKVKVDGLLSEADWLDASPIGPLRQREPREGTPATEETQVRILYDQDYLYVGVTCRDAEPAKVIGTRMARDSVLDDDDRIELLLDTFGDRHNAYYFATNPSGAMVDGLIIENGELNREWDAIWVVRTRTSSEGWTAEFAIPFKSLAFRAGNPTWGFNISRTIKRKFEEDRWASPRLDAKFFQVSEAGELGGIADVGQGRGLDVRPFLSGRWLRDAASGNTTTMGKAGLDAFYNLNANLKWTSTLNTDFGETEVDARQINLTRFPLFFPEKRSFFLENAGVFSFSNTGSELIPFFSRRIGLLGGQEVPVVFGTKLTGKIGRTDLGLLDVQTRDTNFASGKNFFVGRVKQNLFRQSYVGGIFTNGDPANPSSARTLGGDLKLATSNFMNGKNLAFNAFAVKSMNAGVHGDDKAYGAALNYPNDLLGIDLIWRTVEKNFRPALGFAPRTNVRYLNVGFEFDPRPKHFLGVRQMFNEFFYTRYTRHDTGQLESWRLFTAPINWRFHSGERAEFNYVPTFERLFQPFEISPGVVLPPGDYRFTRWRLEAYSASKRKLEVRATWWFGTYWSGHADEIQTTLNYKPAARLQFSFSTSQTFARLNEGTFVARIFSVRGTYSVSPFITFSNLVQYDNDSRNLGWQSRFRWILQPGNDIFLVFSQGWLEAPQSRLKFRVADTRIAAKMQYTFRF